MVEKANCLEKANFLKKSKGFKILFIRAKGLTCTFDPSLDLAAHDW